MLPCTSLFKDLAKASQEQEQKHLFRPRTAFVVLLMWKNAIQFWKHTSAASTPVIYFTTLTVTSSWSAVVPQRRIGSSVLRLTENKSQLELFRMDDWEIQLHCKVTPNHFYDDRDLCCLSGCKLTYCCCCCFILITSSMKTTRNIYTGRVNCNPDPCKENSSS